MTPVSNRAPCLTWIYLLVGSGFLGLHADPSRACTTVVFESNQELFRKAVLVYEGVALERHHHFAVERVWRGSHRETVALTWPVEHHDFCEGHQATVVEKRYLLTIQCDEPEEDDVFTCPARADPIDVAEERLRYLREAHPLTREELAQQLRLVASGHLSLEELAAWTAEMAVIGQVSDWRKLEESEEWSLTLGTIRELNFQLSGRGAPQAELECELRYLTETILPLQVALLEEPEPSLEDVELLEEAYFSTQSLCLEKP